jgi:hypothetical protein
VLGSPRLRYWLKGHWGWFNPNTQWCAVCRRYERPHEHFDFIVPLAQAFQELVIVLVDTLTPVMKAVGETCADLARALKEVTKDE